MREKLTHAVVAQAAVGSARRTEHLAGKAVLELDHLLVDEHLLRARRRSVASAAGVVWEEEEKKKSLGHIFSPKIQSILVCVLSGEISH